MGGTHRRTGTRAPEDVPGSSGASGLLCFRPPRGGLVGRNAGFWLWPVRGAPGETAPSPMSV